MITECKKNTKPYIYLFDTINAYYFYDVNLDEIKAIPEDVYKELKEQQRNDEFTFSSEVAKKIDRIKEKGYLSNHRVKEIKHPATEFLSSYLERKVDKVTLQVTQSCNLRCTYCIYSDVNYTNQRAYSDKMMSFEVAKKAVDFLAEHSIDNDAVNVAFYGGEPLIAFPLIQKVVAYAKERLLGKDLNFSMTSNCTLLTNEIIDFLVQEGIDLMVSIDGPEEIHDQSRRFASDGTGTFQTIIQKLNIIRKKYPEYMEKIQISMVIDPQNSFESIDSLFEDYDIFNKSNVRSSIIDDTYLVEKIGYSEDYYKGLNYEDFLAILSYIGRYDKEKASGIAKQELQQMEEKRIAMQNSGPLPDSTAPGGPCIPGQLRLFVDVNGRFAPCERVSERSDIMNIGNLDDGFDYTKIEQLMNVAKLTENECRDCWAFRYCTQCAKQADDNGKFNRDMKLQFCKGIRDTLDNLFKNVVLIEEIKNYY